MQYVQRFLTMAEVEAQLRRKTQQQQQLQQQPQGMLLTGADSGMLGSLRQLGPAGQHSMPLQLPQPGALQPEHMQRGPPGFTHTAGATLRAPQYDSQHLGIPSILHVAALWWTGHLDGCMHFWCTRVQGSRGSPAWVCCA